MSDLRNGMEPAPIFDTGITLEKKVARNGPLTIELKSDSFVKFKGLDVKDPVVRNALAEKGIVVNSGTLLVKIRESHLKGSYRPFLSATGGQIMMLFFISHTQVLLLRSSEKPYL